MRTLIFNCENSNICDVTISTQKQMKHGCVAVERVSDIFGLSLYKQDYSQVPLATCKTRQPWWSYNSSEMLLCYSLSNNVFYIEKYQQCLTCGSISRGYRDALVTMIPFWTDNSSLGSPCRAHSPIVAASVSMFTKFRSWEEIR